MSKTESAAAAPVDGIVIRSCGTCAAWKLFEGPDECGESLGYCRLMPPVFTLDATPNDDVLDDNGNWLGRQVHSHIYWSHPIVVDSSWCLQWRCV